MIRKHIVISGTGRTGTTFLVELFTELGLETGVATHGLTPKNPIGNAGLEYDIRKNDAPRVVKSPHFCEYAHEVLNRPDICLEHVFIPMRDLRAAAESRRYVTKLNIQKTPFIKKVKQRIRKWILNHRARPYSGGLWATESGKEQEQVLLMKNYELVLALSDSMVPVTFLKYPRHLKDPQYLFEKLGPVLTDIDFNSFKQAYSRVVRPELIHNFGE